MTIADNIIRFARSKIGTIVRYNPKNQGKCEELVYAALDHANAEKGLKVLSAQKGDIITFSSRNGRVVFKLTATAQGKKYDVQEDYAIFRRGNHIAIVSAAPDRNGKVFVLEQNVGKSKSVTESPINTRNSVSYAKKFPAGMTFAAFKNEYSVLIKSELTKEKARALINAPGTWNSLKGWFSTSVNYSFTITVTYTGSGTIEYFRPRKKG